MSDERVGREATEADGVPTDPGIPGLEGLARGALGGALAGAGLRAPIRWTVLKHHPGSRCTLRAERNGRRLIVKAYAEDPSSLVTLMERFAQAGLASGRGPSVPPLVAFRSDLRTLVTSCFDQPPGRDLIAEGAAPRAGELAAGWLRTTARTPIDLGRPYGSGELLAEAQGWTVRLRRANADLGAEALRPLHDLAASPPVRTAWGLRHGSFSASHVFDLGTGPGVVDWDGFRQGPIELDAGRFLAGLSSMAAGRRHLAEEARRAGDAFLAGLAGLVEPAALAWFRAAALLRLGYYASVRRPRRWEARAASLLAEASSRLTDPA